jgi:hypothetical protein
MKTIEINILCNDCQEKCKQNSNLKIVYCPKYCKKGMSNKKK